MTDKEYMMEMNQIMHNYPDKQWNRREIVIWAAAWRSCQTCGAGINQPCTSVAKSVNTRGRQNRWPHDVRIDYKLIVEKLKEKGYHAYGQGQEEE